MAKAVLNTRPDFEPEVSASDDGVGSGKQKYVQLEESRELEEAES